MRDENGLEAALARPRQKWHCDTAVDLPTLAAAYAFGLITNHPYRDGNKRIGFLALVTFLEMHGLMFTATDAEVVAEILGLEPKDIRVKIGESQLGQSTGSGGSTTCPSQAPAAPWR